MTGYCPDCGSAVIDVAYVTSGPERARRCNRCELEKPYSQTWVYVEEDEGVYHANADCERVDPTDSSTIQPRVSANAVPCFECFGVGGRQMTERIPPEQREHETYESDEWTTAHIDAVDNLFVSDSGDPESDDYVASHARIGNPDRVRIDLDGVGSGGASAHDLHDNVQASIWLSPEFAEQLYRDLGRILDSDTNDAGDTEADQ